MYQLSAATDFRPYFHIHDQECEQFVNKNKPRPGLILGVTNPFFETMCKHWPHMLSIGSTQSPILGFVQFSFISAHSCNLESSPCANSVENRKRRAAIASSRMLRQSRWVQLSASTPNTSDTSPRTGSSSSNSKLPAKQVGIQVSICASSGTLKSQKCIFRIASKSSPSTTLFHEGFRATRPTQPVLHFSHCLLPSHIRLPHCVATTIFVPGCSSSVLPNGIPCVLENAWVAIAVSFKRETERVL